MDNQNNFIGLNNQNTPKIKRNIEQIFSGDSYGLFVFDKIEKIVTALYLLSGLMSDTEPMRRKIRSLGNELISNTILMSERVWGEDYLQKNIINILSELNLFFDIANTTKMISKMNYEIISEEIQKMSGFLLNSMKNYSSAKIAFPEDIFSGDYNYIPDKNFSNRNIGLENMEQYKANDFYKGQKDIKDIIKNNDLNNMSHTRKTEPDKNIKDRDNRQDIIKEMLKGGVKLTIKDFAQKIKGCSEKTIQRELIAMLSSGVLKKEGERRWSKYFLA